MDPSPRGQLRRELVEWLDRFVAHQHYYLEAHGRYSKVIGPVGLPVPAKLGHQYEIHVVEAGPERLRVVAQSDLLSGSPDRVSIDDGFQIKANFKIPNPRPPYLRYVALKTLHALRGGADIGLGLEKTAFRSYFRYDRKTDSRGRVVVSALGQEEPVLGEKIEIGPEGLTAGSEWAILTEAFGPGMATGDLDAMRASEQFARKVFRGELGRVPDSPEELALFEGLQPASNLVAQVANSEPEIEALQTPVEAKTRTPASAVAIVSNPSKNQGNFRTHGLEIESVPEDN